MGRTSMSWNRYLLVALGGALGSVGRYWVGGWVPRLLGPAFPYGTLAVNVLGSFLISLVMGVALSTTTIPVNLRLFLTTGILGGFTTYSTFNYETLVLLQQRFWLTGGLNLAATFLGCLAAGALGFSLSRLVTGA